MKKKWPLQLSASGLFGLHFRRTCCYATGVCETITWTEHGVGSRSVMVAVSHLLNFLRTQTKAPVANIVQMCFTLSLLILVGVSSP